MRIRLRVSSTHLCNLQGYSQVLEIVNHAPVLAAILLLQNCCTDPIRPKWSKPHIVPLSFYVLTSRNIHLRIKINYLLV